MIMRDILNQKLDVNCLGCAIADGTVTPPGGLICATEHFALHQDPIIPIAGFLIAASKAHVRSIADFDAPARYELIELIYQGIAALKSTGITQEVTLVQEERSGHFHVWLFPWHAWIDEAGFNHSVANLRVIITYAKNNLQTPEEVKHVLEAVFMVRNELQGNKSGII